MAMTRGELEYRTALRSAVRALWSGVWSKSEFSAGMKTTIRRYFTLAWKAGAAECKILWRDLTTREKSVCELAIRTEYHYVSELADAVVENNKASKGKLSSFFPRIDLWVGRYRTLRNRAMQMACANKKLMWGLGIAEHCMSCTRLAGKIKRASFWEEHDVYPGHPTKLICMISAKGVDVCKCGFVETDLPCTPGPLPNLP